MSAPYAECDVVAIVENYTIPRFMPMFVDALIHGLIDGILALPASGGAPADTPEPLAGLHLPADSCVSHVGAGTPAPGDSRSPGAHSTEGQIA